MAQLTVHTPDGVQKISFEGIQPLSLLMADLPDAPLRPCGGAGRCGQCAVYAEGSLSPAPDARGKVLSCQASATGNADVWLPRRQVLTQIETQTPERGYALLPFEGEYGAAVDIGTTTLVLRLLRLADGKTLATVACENPQRMIASDVIGRIEAALNGKLPLLTSMIRDKINMLEQAALASVGLDGAQASLRVIAGNTTMLYLYRGLSPAPLSSAPFQADCLFDLQMERDYYPRCMGAFVGADITCAVLSSGMCEKDETALLIDIGTNGEIALWHGGRLTCCATAAGPAFEGWGISHGVDSVPGAIDRVTIVNGQLCCATIGRQRAVGICGSGLIDLIAALLDLELLDETGAMDDDIQIAPGVTLTRKDVRQVQLAKAAIAAGIKTLIEGQGLTCRDIQHLYIAGGFGSHLSLRSAARIGLIPDELARKALVIGNASLGGAERILLRREDAAFASRLAQSAKCLNLGGSKPFSDAFVACMMFE